MLAPPSSSVVMGIVTARSGSALSVTRTVTVPPSATPYEPCPKLTITAGTSSSVIETTVSLVVPSDTPVGRFPKPSFTLSSSSSSVSWVALKEKVFAVSPALNTTFAGTPE